MARKISIFLYPDFQVLDATGPLAAFEIAQRLSAGAYTIELCSIPGGMVRSSSGVALPSGAARARKTVDTLIVIGGHGSRQAMHCTKTQAFVRAQARSARRMCSVCSGAFLLAAAGLLDGRQATTHWRRAEELQRLFPLVCVKPDAIYVRDRDVWTSAGISAGIDLALALIGEDLGDDFAQRVAQEMVVYYRRPGGQSQFSALLEMGGGDGRFAALLSWMRGNLEKSLGVPDLADRAAMSPRHFSRAFTQSVGMSPARAVERLRVEAARERVEQSDEPIELIAQRIGFSDPERMRRAFLRAFGQPPQAMRRAGRRQERA